MALLRVNFSIGNIQNLV